MLDHDHAIALGDKAVKDFEEQGDIVEMQAGRRLVKNQERAVLVLLDEMVDELQPLGLAAAQRVDRLAEPQVIEPDLGQKPERAGDRPTRVERFEKFDRLAGGHLEHVVDRFSFDLDGEDRRAEAFALALRAAEVKVAEELHFDFLEPQPAAPLAPALAGIERERARGKPARERLARRAEHLADPVVGTEVNRRRGPRAAGQRRLIDHHHIPDVLVPADRFHKPRGLVLAGLVPREVTVEDVADERGLAGP